MEKKIDLRICSQIDNFINILSEFPLKFFPRKEIFYQVTNIVWDLVTLYQLDIPKMARENSELVSFDPEIFIAASYRPFILDKKKYRGSFNIFGSKRSVYTGSKSIREFKEASERMIKLASTYSLLPLEEKYDEILAYELKIKKENREKRKNKIPGKRGRKPRLK